MNQWESIYRQLEAEGLLTDRARQREGTKWLERLWSLLGPPRGAALDLGCGTGADMVRYAEKGWQPVGLEREPLAATLVARHLGFPTVVGDLTAPLPFADGHFALVAGRCSFHFVPPTSARSLYREIYRLLCPGGRLLFVVNSDEHRRRQLQYDYSGAAELEPGYWHIPSIGRSYLFYTPELARELLGAGWRLHLLEESDFDQWDIAKRVVIGVAQKDG